MFNRHWFKRTFTVQTTLHAYLWGRVLPPTDGDLIHCLASVPQVSSVLGWTVLPVEVQPHLSGFHELLKQWAIVEVIVPWMLLLSRSRCQAAKGDITMGKWGNTVKERNFVFSKAIHGFVQIEVTSWGYFYTASGNSQVLQSWETYIPFISHISR